MVRRIADAMAKGAALIVTDRRWGVTMSAAALGFGLFVGVAIGPGTAGTLATGPQQLIEIPGLAADGGEEGEAETGGGPPLLAGISPEPAPAEEPSSLEAFPSAAPLAPEASEPPPAEEPAPEPTPPAGAESEPEAVETTALGGTVVHVNPAAGSYALAIKGGELVPVHAAKLPRPGMALTLEGLQLANGTFSEEGVRKRMGEKKPEASLRGVVTFVDPDPLAPAYTVSGRGASLPIQVPPDPTGVLPPLPAVGSRVNVRVGIEPAGLVQRALEVEPGEPATYLDLSGIYGGIVAETGRFLLSADDTRASEQDLSLAASPKIDATKLQQGDSYLATATVEADGSLTMVGIAHDEHRKGAEDPRGGQGDLKLQAESG